MIDAYTGEESPIPNLPKFPGQHLSVGPDGKLFVTDTQLGPFGGAKGEWGVAVCDTRGGNWTMIAQVPGCRRRNNLAEEPPASGHSARTGSESTTT